MDTTSKILRDDATYIIIGGTGGIGRSMTTWMVHRGARNIVLLSRSDKVSESTQRVITDAAHHGANVIVKRCDVSNMQDVDRMIDGVKATLPPIRGVVHSAMVLDVSIHPI